MTEVYGTVLDVSTQNVATELTEPALSGSTTVHVEDASIFSETGGTILIGDVIYDYQTADIDTGVLVLTTPLVNDIDLFDAVEIYPPAPDKVALISLGDESDAVSVHVPHALQAFIEDGFREDGAGEAVRLVERRPGEFYIEDVANKSATLNIDAVPSELTADVSTAMLLAADAQAIADGKVNIFYNTDGDSPANPAVGDLWLVQPQNQLRRWDGIFWLDSQDQALTDALIAAQNAQDTADSKIVVFYQTTAPVGVGESEGDQWVNTTPGEGNAEYRYTGGLWIPKPLGTGALETNGIDPDRLTVGVGANAIQDPHFLDPAVRQPPHSRWTIEGPDPTYPLVKYAAATNPGGIAAFVVWYITGEIPCDPGRSVRVASRITRTSDANGLARLRPRFTKADGSTYIPTRAVDVVEEITAGVWSLFEGVYVAPEGTVSVAMAIETSGQTAGTIKFVKPECQVLWSRVQSTNYVEGLSGWAFDNEVAQVPDLNVIGDLGATNITTDSLTVGGDDLGDILAATAQGVVAYDVSQTGTNTNWTSGTTEKSVFRGSVPDLKADGLYMFQLNFHWRPKQGGTLCDVRIRYTVDGTTPTVASPIFRIWRVVGHPTLDAGEDVNFIKMYSPAADYSQFRFCITLQCTAGSAQIAQDVQHRNLEYAMIHLGNDHVVGNGNLAQVSKQPVVTTDPEPAADPDPVSTYTRTWTSDWHRSYDGDLGTRNGDDTSTELYQGYVSSTHGRTRSLFGFNDADIRSKLAGATIKSVKITYRVKHAWQGAGLDVYVSSHNYASKPATWGSAAVNENRANFDNCKEGSTYTKSLPIAVGNEFKSGVTKGLGFGPGPSTSTAYYGYMYSGVKLTIQYEK